MLTFGYFTDTHFRFETPEQRTDNFLQSMLLKLTEIGDIFKKEKVDYVLFGGDLYDSDSVAKTVITSLQSILRSWQLPIIGVVGSHDYIGYQMRSLKSTALGITESAGLIELIGGAEHERDKLLEKNNTKVRVVGFPHTHTFTDSKENMYCGDTDIYTIQIVHADLNDKPVQWPHILIEDNLTDADLCLSGHYHPGWEKPIVKQKCTYKGHCTFVNPGSIARMKNTGVRRIPRVCIIKVEEKNLVDLKYITLKSALEHPFLPKEKKEDEMPMLDVQKFLDLLGNQEVSSIDIKMQLPKVAKEYGFDEDIVEVAFDLLDGKEEEI